MLIEEKLAFGHAFKTSKRGCRYVHSNIQYLCVISKYSSCHVLMYCNLFFKIGFGYLTWKNLETLSGVKAWRFGIMAGRSFFLLSKCDELIYVAVM